MSEPLLTSGLAFIEKQHVYAFGTLIKDDVLYIQQSGLANPNKRLGTSLKGGGSGLDPSSEDVGVSERVHIIPGSFQLIQHLYDDAAWCLR